jgi:AcrR family transcriptional regulator
MTETARDRLLRTGLALFSEHGVEGTSVRDIAGAAGVNVATVYHHFGSKRGLFLAVFREAGYEQMLTRASSELGELARQTEPRQVIEEILAGSWTAMAGTSELIRLFTLEALRGDPEARQIASEWRDRGQEALEQALIVAKVTGRAKAPRLAHLLRQIVWGAFMDGLINDTLGPDAIRKMAREFAALLVTGEWR